MAGAPPPHRVVVCGATEKIGQSVIEGLKPEYEVVLFCLSAAATAAEVPHVLRGEAPPSQSSRIGSNAFSPSPSPTATTRPLPLLAVVYGAAWSESDARLLKDAMQQQQQGDAGSAGVASPPPPYILRNDRSVPSPPVGPAYGPHVVGRVKACLGRLVRGDKVEGPEEGIVWY